MAFVMILMAVIYFGVGFYIMCGPFKNIEGGQRKKRKEDEGKRERKERE